MSVHKKSISDIEILQIMPASGWFACYGLDLKELTISTEPLVCWALVKRIVEEYHPTVQGGTYTQSKTMTFVEGFIASETNGTSPAEEIGPFFLGYAHPSEDAAEWMPRMQEEFKRQIPP